MNINTLQKRLEVWKRILFMNIGAFLILLLQAVLHYEESHSLIFDMSWYGAWFVVQFAALLPGFVLLWGKHWMNVPLPERLNTIFGYFAVTWFTMLPVGLRIGPDTSKTFNFFWLGCGIALVIGYWRMHQKSLGFQNEMFP